MAKKSEKHGRRSSSKQSPRDLNATAQSLIAAVENLVTTVSRLVESVPTATEKPVCELNLSELVRALLVAEKGGRYEACVLQSIRDYQTAYDNARRYENAPLPEPYKADVYSRFRQQQDCAAQTLEFLQIQPFEPEMESPVDPRLHSVVKVLPCELEDNPEVVIEVLRPGCRWIDDQGSERIVPAEIIARGPLSDEGDDAASGKGAR